MDEIPSKSEKKRQADKLQSIAVKFIDLSLEKLKSLPLTDPLYKAIVDAKSITSHGAKRRQAQLIGKLMRSADYEAIITAYEYLIHEDSAITASFHEIELWRDRLIAEGNDTLTEFIRLYQPPEVQHLRHLIKKAIHDQQKVQNTGAAKALFRYLKAVIL